MQHHAVLDVATVSNPDRIDVTPRCGVEPEGDIITEDDVARQLGRGSEVDTLPELGVDSSKWLDGHCVPEGSRLWFWTITSWSDDHVIARDRGV
jgi:hypothetical protein